MRELNQTELQTVAGGADPLIENPGPLEIFADGLGFGLLTGTGILGGLLKRVLQDGLGIRLWGSE